MWSVSACTQRPVEQILIKKKKKPIFLLSLFNVTSSCNFCLLSLDLLEVVLQDLLNKYSVSRVFFLLQNSDVQANTRQVYVFQNIIILITIKMHQTLALGKEVWIDTEIVNN